MTDAVQASLFDDAPGSPVAPERRARARRRDPVTARLAAGKARDLTGAIRDLYTRHTARNAAFGLTDDELVALLTVELDGVHGPTVKSARSRLANAGWLTPTGSCRPSNTGHPMRVYALAGEHRREVA